MFGLFKKKTASLPMEPASLPGWEAIEKAFAEAYPGQTPKHWAHDGVHRMHDLQNPPENPLEGVSIFDGGSFWHYVSFGLSDLYRKEGRSDWSGFGYELTFRLGKQVEEKDAPLWPVNVLVSMARAAFRGSEFAPGHTVKTGPIDGNPKTKQTALLIVKDPGFDLQLTPHGKLAFLQLVGVPNETRERGLQLGVQVVIDELQAADPNLITRL
jgi:suppressor of fused-like protein